MPSVNSPMLVPKIWFSGALNDPLRLTVPSDCPDLSGIVLSLACDTIYCNVKETGLELGDLGLNPSFAT